MTALHRRLRAVVGRYLPETAARELVRELAVVVADHALDTLYAAQRLRGAARAANDDVGDDGTAPAVAPSEVAMAAMRQRLLPRGGGR